MTNPVAEAVQRAWDGRQPGLLKIGVHMENAAVEALDPVRKLHRREVIKVCICQEECEIHEGRCPLDTDFVVCRECYRFAIDEVYPYFGERDMEPVAWPCATARLVYSTEELA